MPRYAVIDLGSNTVRLVVYEVRTDRDRKRPATSKDFRSLINDKVMAGLSAHVEQGAFTERGIARAIDVLRGHLKRARALDCKRIDIFATAVLRNCVNSKQAVAAIERGTNARIALLSARDEAHLGFVGASCDRPIERGTIVDLGGGSTELTRVEGGRDFDDVSIGQGSLSSYAEHVARILPTPAEAAAIEQSFWARADAALADRSPYRAERLYGVGGSVRAAAKLYAQAFGLPERPKRLEPHHFSDLLALLESDPSAFAHHAVKAVPERIHTVVPGCVIVGSLMRELGARSIEVCRRGVREGYLIERMLS